ncbi:hypothetical protein DT075_09355 [Bacillus licheniformis]|nr:hypothetical protein DT075_09355 [Bacillus licheniformis]
MQQIIAEKKPDIVFCTHALPSYLLNRLKGQFPDMKVVNVYTDFFVNRIWGREKIDYHFAPIQTELLLKSHHCEKIDIFSHAYRRLEKASSAAYLSWIQYFPKVYSSVYHLLACGRHETAKRHLLYELTPN